MTSVFFTAADLAAVFAGAVAAAIADLRLGVAAALAVAAFAADAGSAELTVDTGFGALAERVVGRFLAAGLRVVAAGFRAVAAGFRAVAAGLRVVAAALRVVAVALRVVPPGLPAVAAAFRPVAGVIVDDALVVAVDRRCSVPGPDPVDPVDVSSAIAFSLWYPSRHCPPPPRKASRESLLTAR